MKGQALVEYLLIFAALALVSINIIKAMHGYFGESLESLNYALQTQLTVGVCSSKDRLCYFEGFLNKSP